MDFLWIVSVWLKLVLARRSSHNSLFAHLVFYYYGSLVKFCCSKVNLSNGDTIAN